MSKLRTWPLLATIAISACAPPERPPLAPPIAPTPTAPEAPAPPPGSEVTKPLPLLCERDLVATADGSLDDFEDGNSQVTPLGGRSGYWFTAADNHGSSIEPKGDFRATDGGPGASTKAVRVVGKTLPELPAWGAVLGVSFLPDNRLYDGSQYRGVSFWAKAGPASTTTFRFKVSDVNTHPAGGVCRDEPNGCWNHFGAELKLTTEWKEYRFAFAELTQEAGWGNPRPPGISANKLISLDFSIPRGQDFELWVDDVKLLRCQ